MVSPLEMLAMVNYLVHRDYHISKIPSSHTQYENILLILGYLVLLYLGYLVLLYLGYDILTILTLHEETESYKQKNHEQSGDTIINICHRLMVSVD